jgi:predicted lipoprotein with Yx(FWY)xxD motif
MSRLFLVAAAAVVAAAFAVPALAASSPVAVIHSAKFGNVLASSKGHLAFYTWNKEKDNKVHCTGACAKVWPPITVPKGTTVAAHVKGAMGVFGTIKRPDGSTQLTFDKHPLYTFHGDTATKILCNGVDGWYVVKA